MSVPIGPAVQGGRTVALVLAFGSAFHALVARSGSPYVAMGAHALYDAISGVSDGRLGERPGHPRDPSALEPPAVPVPPELV